MQPCLSAQTLLPALSVLCAAIALTALMTIAGTPVAAQDAPSPEDFDTICRGSTAIGTTPSRIEPCKILLAAKETLQGTANTLNWTTTINMSGWTGLALPSENEYQLRLNSLSLNGRIPPILGNLTNLQRLQLNNNQLTGSIPPQLANLTQLTQLALNNNQLTGSIPPQLANLTQLTQLALNNNQLTGSIPPQLANLTNLERLYLYNNQLTGSIPPQLANLTNLMQLYLDNNELTGNIPTELANLTNLERLYLYNNELTGNIPTELANLTNLQRLQLNNNQLTGNIPTELGTGPISNTLRYLYLNNNKLTGNIPPELVNLSQSMALQQTAELGNRVAAQQQPTHGHHPNRTRQLPLSDCGCISTTTNSRATSLLNWSTLCQRLHLYNQLTGTTNLPNSLRQLHLPIPTT